MIKLFGKSSEEKIMAPKGSAEYGKLVREAYSDTVSEPKFLSDDFYESLCKYDDITNSIAKLKIEKDVIEHTIMAEMREHEVAYVRERKVTWKKSCRSSFDSKLLKKEEPEIYEKYSRSVSSRLFKIK
ncbi:MAG: hypothetical protein ACRCXA_07505 [Peptostreptococcaceae bacterium]